MTSYKRTVFSLMALGVGLGLSVLAQESGNRTLLIAGTVLGLACMLFGAYTAMKSLGQSDPGSSWDRRGRRLQWIGGFVIACGVGLAIAMFSRRPIDDMSMTLFIGMMVALALGAGLIGIGLGLQAFGAPQPVIDYAKEHPYPSHEDRMTEG